MFCFLSCETHRLIVFIVCQPFDEDYLNHLDPPVKHMSFHAYLRKLTGGADKWVFSISLVEIHTFRSIPTLSLSCRGKFAALENISCKIKSGCEGHPPWPEGICTKCQPSAITLNRQVCDLRPARTDCLKYSVAFRSRQLMYCWSGSRCSKDLPAPWS